jgi:hypothetical protein
MHNSFFTNSLDKAYIKQRIQEIEHSKIGLYSVGLYPASLAYNSAMQAKSPILLLAPRSGRELLGAFSQDSLQGMDPQHVRTMERMAYHEKEGDGQRPAGDHRIPNTLETLISQCELVILSASSNHIEADLAEACDLRAALNRETVVIACLAGSFSHDPVQNNSYVLCEKYPNLAFFSGFHRHEALRDPFDSFTANFCHPDALNALLGAHLLDKLSPNIQVSPGIHNVEAQYIKAAKNIASIFAGFGYEYHRENPGILPAILTLLKDQCLDQAATVSMYRRDRHQLYTQQPIALTELGYGVPRIEASLNQVGERANVRDHTFTQLTAMVADVWGSMMHPAVGTPTRNFQAGQVLAQLMHQLQRCPIAIEEFEQWCQRSGLNTGGLEGLKALQYWPQITAKYGIQAHDASMIHLLYMALCGNGQERRYAYLVMTQSRELANYCQESVRPTHSRKYADALNHLDQADCLDRLVNAVIADNAYKAIQEENGLDSHPIQTDDPVYLRAMRRIEIGW